MYDRKILLLTLHNQGKEEEKEMANVSVTPIASISLVESVSLDFFGFRERFGTNLTVNSKTNMDR